MPNGRGRLDGQVEVRLTFQRFMAKGVQPTSPDNLKVAVAQMQPENMKRSAFGNLRTPQSKAKIVKIVFKNLFFRKPDLKLLKVHSKLVLGLFFDKHFCDQNQL